MINENKKYEKKVIVVTEGGVGNRINFINNIIYDANNLKRRIKIYWPKNYDCNADFHKLFKIDNLDIIDNYDKIVALAKQPEEIRGYGHIKIDSIKRCSIFKDIV